MKGLMLHCDFHQMILGCSQKSNSLTKIFGFSDKKIFPFYNGSGNCWKIKKGKPGGNFTPVVQVRAASSSSPSLGGSSSNYSEPLIGEQLKKKRRSIAGIDQDELVEPRLLADPDSCFCEFKGVDIHYKVCEPEPETPSTLEEQDSSQLGNQNKIGLPVILLHGFGASAFSWHRVMKPFAQVTGSKVLAFDRPAFGLTSRVRYSGRPLDNNDTVPLNPYSMAFSVLATLYFINFLAAEKAVLVGYLVVNNATDIGNRHSAGSLTAVDTYFEAPDRVAALILVAPAIFAPLSAPKVTNKQKLDKENQESNSGNGSGQHPNIFGRLKQILSKFYQYVMTTILQIWRGMVDMVNSLYRKALAAILRSALAVMLVRMIINKFGTAAVRNSWYDGSQVTDSILHGYTKPLRTKDWDRALVEYTVAMLTDSQAKLKPPLETRLQEISCPVLIITGDKDRLVPSWNSERLSRVIPGSQLEVIKNCGHLPHEEKPEEFVSVVAKFLQTVFAGSEELCFQT